jgi:hypothetical protein
MRLYEFTNAEEQLALLRTIIDNTWTAIAQQAAEQQRAEAERKSQAKLKPRGKKRGKGGKVHIPSPPSPLPKKPNANTKPQAPSPSNPPTQAHPNATAQQPTAYPKPYPQPQSTAVNPESATTPHPKTTHIAPIKPSFGFKDGYFGMNIGALEKDGYGDDRHSKNGIATLKK